MAKVSLNINAPVAVDDLITFLTEVSRIHPRAHLILDTDRTWIEVDAKADCCFVTDFTSTTPIAVVSRSPSGIKIAWADRPLIPSVISAVNKTLHAMPRLKGSSEMDISTLFNICSKKLSATLCVKRDSVIVETLMTKKEAIETYLGGRSKRVAMVDNRRRFKEVQKAATRARRRKNRA